MAYLVFHDAFDRGAMEAWPMPLAQALARAEAGNEELDQEGDDACGRFAAYEELPHGFCIYKMHQPQYPERRIK